MYHVDGFAVHVSTISHCLLSSTASCTLLQVKAPKGKPHAPHVVQDVRNKKDGFLKYKKVFCAFCAFYSFPFSLPLGAASGCVLRVLRVPGVLRVSYSCLRCCLWGCLNVSCMFCMFYRFRATGCGRGSKMTQPRISDEEESQEESEEEAKEAEEEDEEEEEGNDAANVKDGDEPFLAQRAPRSTHLEVARIAAQAQPKGTPVKATPEAKPEPEQLSKKKKKEKTKSPPKKKSKGKGKVEEKPKHVRYAVEGEPQRTMPTRATRGEKYQAGAAYDNDVQAMQRTLKSDHEVSLRRVCQHYKVCLAEETQARRKLAGGCLGVQCADGLPLWHEECTKHGRCQRTV